MTLSGLGGPGFDFELRGSPELPPQGTSLLTNQRGRVARPSLLNLPGAPAFEFSGGPCLRFFKHGDFGFNSFVWTD